MKKNIHLIALLLIIGQCSMAQILINCSDLINVSIGPTGTVELTPDMLLEGNVDPNYTYNIQPSMVDCDDVGTDVEVTITATEGTESEACISTVSVDDFLSPVAIVDIGGMVELDETGYLELTPDMIDDGSYDNCSDITMTVSPNYVDCNAVNPVSVTLTVADASGNTAFAITEITVKSPTALACNQDFYFPVFANDTEFTVGDAIEGGPYPCIDNYEVTLLENGVELPSNFLNFSDIGKELVSVISDGFGNSCWSEFTVIGGNVAANICIKNSEGEALQGVELVSGIETDNSGCAGADLPSGQKIIPTKQDVVTNGLDIGDEILLREQILSITTLEPIQLAASNLADPEELNVSTFDLVLLNKARMGDFDIENQWIFFDNSITLESGVVPSENDQGFVINQNSSYDLSAIKMGDINGNANLNFTSDDIDQNFVATDQLLNLGETINVEFTQEVNDHIKGFEIIIPDNLEAFSIVDVSSNLDGFNFSIEENTFNGNAFINWVAPDLFNIAYIEQVVLNIELKANKNGILSDELMMELNGRDMMILDGSEDLHIGFDWNEKIVLDAKDIEYTESFSLSPNPANDRVQIEALDDKTYEMNIQIYDATGALYRTVNMLSGGMLELNEWNDGMYIIHIKSEKGIQIQKLIKI